MYEEFYGFRVRPFSILPDADFLYRSRGHRFALSLLEYGLNAQTGFTVITGEIGSGKTTLVQYLLKNVGSDHTIGHITNTGELNHDLMKWLLQAFDIRRSSEQDVDLYEQFVAFVRKKYSEGKDCVLIIDEAQHLNPETLEALRLISNINTGKAHLLKILLVGQPELQKTLARPDLVQFAQRVSASYHLKPLSLLETREYIGTRLKIAGGSDLIFDRLACDLIFILSGGIPRQTNILCDTALVYGYADGQRHIGLDTVIAVLRDRVSSQAATSLPLPPELDRPSIENMIREVREKEFARESDAGMSGSKAQSTSTLRATAAVQRAAEMDPPTPNRQIVTSDPDAATLNAKRDNEGQKFGNGSSLPAIGKAGDATLIISTGSPARSAPDSVAARLQVPHGSAGREIEEVEIQLSIFDAQSKIEGQSIDQAVRSAARRAEALPAHLRPFKIYPAEEVSPAAPKKLDAEPAKSRALNEAKKGQHQPIFLRTALTLAAVSIIVVLVLFVLSK